MCAGVEVELFYLWQSSLGNQRADRPGGCSRPRFGRPYKNVSRYVATCYEANNSAVKWVRPRVMYMSFLDIEIVMVQRPEKRTSPSSPKRR